MDKRKQLYVSLIIPAFLGCFSIWFSLSLFASAFGISTPVEYIQAIGSLFSAVTVCVAIISIWLQQRNFNTQLSEIRQNELTKTFFQLLEARKEALSRIRCKKTRGSGCLLDMLSDYFTYFNYAEAFNTYILLYAMYKECTERKHSELLPYLSITKLIFQTIENDSTPERKYLYIETLLSQLTEDELIFLAHHAVFDNNTKYIITLANKFSIFRSIKNESAYKFIRKHYLPSAFGLTKWEEPT